MYRYLCLGFVFFLTGSFLLFAGERIPIKVKGDSISYKDGGSNVVAVGNVEVKYQGMTLYCDKASVNLDTGLAQAQGSVVLKEGNRIVYADKLEYDFVNKKGKIIKATFEMKPYYGSAYEFEQLEEGHLLADKCNLTTCDPSNPHPLDYHLEAKSVEIFLGEKVIARKVKFKIGKITLLYFPKYVHYITDKRPKVKVVFGKRGDWGPFVLTTWKRNLSENLDAKFNLDWRDKRGIGTGVDLFYHYALGDGVVRSYYIREKDDVLYPKVDRYKFQILHKWEISDDLELMAEYHKLSDADFLKDYFYNEEYESDSVPDSYAMLSYNLDWMRASVYVKKRVNHFEDETEYLPQLRWVLYPYNLFGDFYLSSDLRIENLRREFSNGSFPWDCFRADSYFKLGYKSNIWVFDFYPFVGIRQTYYSRLIDSESAVMGLGYAGFDMSFRMFKDYGFWGRHIIKPKISYRYNSRPTVEPNKIYQFDSLDGINREHKVIFGVENLLEGAEFGRSTFDVDICYQIKPERGSYFDYMDLDWALDVGGIGRIDTEYRYGLDEGMWRSGTIDVWVDGLVDNWKFGAGHEYKRNEMAQTTLQVSGRILKELDFVGYYRYEFETGTFCEQGYKLIKDLGCWQLELGYTRGKWNESNFWVIMRIKALPDIGVKLTKSYHPREVSDVE